MSLLQTIDMCGPLTEARGHAESAQIALAKAWAIALYAPERTEVLQEFIADANKAYAKLSASLALLQAPRLPPLRGLRVVETAFGSVDLPVVGRIGGDDEPRPAA